MSGSTVEPAANDGLYDPNDPDDVQFLMEQAVVRQFGFKMGFKIMNMTKEDAEPISFI